MKHILFSLTVLSAIISCSIQRRPEKTKVVDLGGVYEQNKKDSILATGWYYITNNGNGFKRQLDRTEEYYFIDPMPIVVKEQFDKIEIYETDFKGQYEDYIGVSIRIDKKYANLWSEATGKSIGKQLGLVIDNILVIAPLVNARIEGGRTALNRSVYTREDLEGFKKQLE